MKGDLGKYKSVLCLSAVLICCLSGPLAAAEAHDPYNIELYTIPAGFPPYAISVGVAELINKNSSWLHAVALEGRGPTEAMKFVVTEKKKQTNFFFFNQPKWIWSAQQGHEAFKKFPYDYMGKIKSVALIGVSALTIVTLDRDIKALSDFAGKKVAVDGGPGRIRQLLFEDMFRQAGVLEKVKFEYMSAPSAAEAMRDGLIDGCYIAWDLVGLPNKWIPNSWTNELLSTKKINFVPIPKTYFENYKNRTQYLDHFVEFPPKFFGEDQVIPASCFVSTHSWNCHEDVPDKVVYEFCSLIYENIGKLKEYHPSASIITKDTMAKMDVTEKMIHPAALKFYKERGVTIGTLN